VDIGQAFYLLSDCERDYLKEQLAKEVSNSSAAVTAAAAAPAMHQLHALESSLGIFKKAVHSDCRASPFDLAAAAAAAGHHQGWLPA
jgi:hypothetical protein